MKTIVAHLRLSSTLTGSTRERCPEVVFSEGETVIAEIRSDVERPHIALADAAVDELIICDDAFSRVVDEEAWVAEFARIVAPRGSVRFTVPAAGVLAWLDAMDAYRYVADISKRGDAPDAALPTGWNRHYTQEQLRALLRDAGFGDVQLRGLTYALPEFRMMLGLLRRNWIGRDRQAEREMFATFGRRDPRDAGGVLTTTWSVTAQRVEVRGPSS